MNTEKERPSLNDRRERDKDILACWPLFAVATFFYGWALGWWF